MERMGEELLALRLRRRALVRGGLLRGIGAGARGIGAGRFWARGALVRARGSLVRALRSPPPRSYNPNASRMVST